MRGYVLLTLASCTNFFSENNSKQEPEAKAKKVTLTSVWQPKHQPILIHKIDLGDSFKTLSVQNFLKTYTESGDGFILSYEELIRQIQVPGEGERVYFGRWLDDFYNSEPELHCDVIIDFQKGEVYLEPQNRCEDKYGEISLATFREQKEITTDAVLDILSPNSDENNGSKELFDELMVEQLCGGGYLSADSFKRFMEDAEDIKRRYGNTVAQETLSYFKKTLEDSLLQELDIEEFEARKYLACVEEHFPQYTASGISPIYGAMLVHMHQLIADPNFELQTPPPEYYEELELIAK